MTTVEERREVARRLRELHLGGGSKDLIERTLSDAIGAWRRSGMSWDFITERLADLIEPSCDRDALLALAEELEEDACWEVQSPGVDNCAWRLKDVCDRIREALGVDDG